MSTFIAKLVPASARRKAGVANIREYEETALKESQRLVQERRDLAAQVSGASLVVTMG
jgi:antitoxin (DNA-binding transcriptional repressor) of toxin-antitoxin stability system